MFGRSRRRPNKSELGLQLMEKQKLRYSYGVKEKGLEKIVVKALDSRDVEGSIIEQLELRLDNVVFRLSLALSRSIARHLVSHGHILVNERRVTISSYVVRVGDVIHLKNLLGSSFEDVQLRLKRFNPPSWLSLDKSALSGKVVRKPSAGEAASNVVLAKVIEYYSR